MNSMDKFRPEITSSRNKLILNQILQANLYECKYKIVASYTWERNDQVFSAVLGRDKILRLTINLNCVNSPLFEGCPHAKELLLFYRAYFIESFIRFLEKATEQNPSDYFAGVVLLEVVSGICSNQRFVGYDIICSGKKRTISSVDIQCAIQALTRLMIAFSDEFDQNQATKCRNYINSLLDYTNAPEILYVNSSRPAYVCTAVFTKLQKLLKTKADELQKYAFFRRIGLVNMEDFSLCTLENACLRSESPVLLGLYIRLVANSSYHSTSSELLSLESFRDCVIRLKESYVSFYLQYNNSSDYFLKDNIEAIKLLSRGLNSEYKEIISDESGVLHYY